MCTQFDMVLLGGAAHKIFGKLSFLLISLFLARVKFKIYLNVLDFWTFIYLKIAKDILENQQKCSKKYLNILDFQ